MMPGSWTTVWPGGQHRVVVGLDDGLAEGPVVQIGRPVPGQQPVGLGQVGIAEQRTDRERLSRRRQQQRAAGRVGLQLRQVGLGELDEILVDPEPALGHPDGRLEIGGQALAPYWLTALAQAATIEGTPVASG
jgi:hypothetical protein